MLANISQFESLSENAGKPGLGIFNPEQAESCTVDNTGTNFDSNTIQPVAPTTPIPGKLPPPDPQWRKTVDERLGKIERTMATKTDLTALEERLATLILPRLMKIIHGTEVCLNCRF